MNLRQDHARLAHHYLGALKGIEKKCPVSQNKSNGALPGGFRHERHQVGLNALCTKRALTKSHLVLFTRPYADDFVERMDKELAVAGLAGTRRRLNGVHRLVQDFA